MNAPRVEFVRVREPTPPTAIIINLLPVTSAAAGAPTLFLTTHLYLSRGRFGQLPEMIARSIHLSVGEALLMLWSFAPFVILSTLFWCASSTLPSGIWRRAGGTWPRQLALCLGALAPTWYIMAHIYVHYAGRAYPRWPVSSTDVIGLAFAPPLSVAFGGVGAILTGAVLMFIPIRTLPPTNS